MIRIIKYLLVAVSLLAARHAPAQAAPALRYDSSVVKQLHPTAEQERKVFKQVDLGLAVVNQNQEENPIARFFSWIAETLFNNTSAEGRSKAQWAFLWLLVAIGLVLAIRLFRKSDFSSFIQGSARQAGFDFSDLADDLGAIDFDERTRKAIGEGDYRLAVRWLYLKQLVLLNERGLIAWQPFKTTMDYAHELAASPLKMPFRELSRLYEYVWYGDYRLDKEAFAKAESEFTQFEKQVHV